MLGNEADLGLMIWKLQEEYKKAGQTRNITKCKHLIQRNKDVNILLIENNTVNI